MKQNMSKFDSRFKRVTIKRDIIKYIVWSGMPIKPENIGM